jgi:hypothetical protein
MPESEQMSQDKVSIVGELRVIEKDKDGNALVLEICETTGDEQSPDQKSSEDQSQLGQERTYKIAREGKGMELFHMSGGKVKITGTLKHEGNQRTLVVDEYVLMSSGLDSQQPQEDFSSSPRPDESSNDTVRPNESSNQTPDDEEDDNIQPEQPRENLQEKQPEESVQKSFFGSEYSFSQRELYRQALERKLDEWEEKCSQAGKSHEQKIDQLEETQGKIDSAKNEAFQAKLEYCENLSESIRENLGKVSSQTQEGWQGFQKGVNEQLRELEIAFSEMEAACKENFSHESGIPQPEKSIEQDSSEDSSEEKEVPVESPDSTESSSE